MRLNHTLATHLLVLALALVAAGAPAALASVHPGDVAPDFRGTDLNGVSHTLSQYRGKPVFLFILGSS